MLAGIDNYQSTNTDKIISISARHIGQWVTDVAQLIHVTKWEHGMYKYFEFNARQILQSVISFNSEISDKAVKQKLQTVVCLNTILIC